MKKTLLILAIFGLAAATNAFALCGVPASFGQQTGGFVVSPFGGQPTGGSFWSYNTGNPTALTGDDSGTWPVAEWCPAYEASAYMIGDWGGDTRIDGCISGKTVAKGIEVMVASFDAADGAQGYYAVASVNHNFGGTEYEFGPDDIVLVPIPKPVVTGTTRNPDFSVLINVAPPAITGVRTDNTATAAELVTGWTLYKQVVARGALAPQTRAKAGWVAVSSAARTAPIAYTETDCATNRDIYLAVGLNYNSGFSSAYVGENSQIVQCGPILAEPDHFKIIDKRPPKKNR